jgi:hypothetical protein
VEQQGPGALGYLPNFELRTIRDKTWYLHFRCFPLQHPPVLTYNPYLLQAMFPPCLLVVDSRFSLYKIRNQKGDSVIHHDRLKRCNDRDIPIAMRRLRHHFFYQGGEQEESILRSGVSRLDKRNENPPPKTAPSKEISASCSAQFWLKNPLCTLDLLHDIDVQLVSCHSPAFGETGQRVNCHVPVYVPPGETLLTGQSMNRGQNVQLCPSKIHTDQGKNFDGNLFSALCEALEVAKTRTTPYHPSSNGQMECYNTARKADWSGMTAISTHLEN